MDSNQSLKIRAIIRIACCIFALGATVTAFIFRMNPVETTGACMISRICVIIMFAAMVGSCVLAFATKSFSPQIDGIPFIISLVGFIGNFIVAPGSTDAGLFKYALTHINSTLTDVDTTQLEIGSYMVMLAGILMISYTIRSMKKGG